MGALGRSALQQTLRTVSGVGPMRTVLALFLLIASGMSAFCQTIQPGDTIDISVWQDPKLDRRITVPKDGTIAFPLAGHLRASGLTPQGLENALRDKLKANYTDRLDITVSLIPPASDQREDDALAPRFYVTGEV